MHPNGHKEVKTNLPNDGGMGLQDQQWLEERESSVLSTMVNRFLGCRKPENEGGLGWFISHQKNHKARETYQG